MRHRVRREAQSFRPLQVRPQLIEELHPPTLPHSPHRHRPIIPQRQRLLERPRVAHPAHAVPREAHRRRARAPVALVVERPLRVPHQRRELPATRPSVSAKPRAPASTAAGVAPALDDPRGGALRGRDRLLAGRGERRVLRVLGQRAHAREEAGRAPRPWRPRGARRARARWSCPPRSESTCASRSSTGSAGVLDVARAAEGLEHLARRPRRPACAVVSLQSGVTRRSRRSRPRWRCPPPRGRAARRRANARWKAASNSAWRSASVSTWSGRSVSVAAEGDAAAGVVAREREAAAHAGDGADRVPHARDVEHRRDVADAVASPATGVASAPSSVSSAVGTLRVPSLSLRRLTRMPL